MKLLRNETSLRSHHSRSATLECGIFVRLIGQTEPWTVRRAMAEERCEVKLGIREEERLTEDEIARRKLGPRGVPGGRDFAKMTPQQEKNIPKTGVFDGHTA